MGRLLFRGRYRTQAVQREFQKHLIIGMVTDCHIVVHPHGRLLIQSRRPSVFQDRYREKTCGITVEHPLAQCQLLLLSPYMRDREGAIHRILL